MTDFQAIRKELEQGIIRPFYIFTGEEKEVMRQYALKMGHLTKATSFQSIVPQLTSKSLFAIRRTFLIENDKTIFDYELSDVIGLMTKSNNSLILKYDTIDGRIGWFKKAKANIIEFNKFDEHSLKSYVQKRIDVSDEIAIILARYCNNEVSRLDNEIHKLKHLDQEITLNVVNDLVTPPLDDRIFEMINCVAKRNGTTTFELYSDLIELGESPIKIVSLLYTKFKQILIVQSLFNSSNAEIAGKSGLNFYQVNYARELCGQFTSDRLVTIIQTVFRCEVAMKTGKLDPKLSMDRLLIDILN